MRWQAERRRNTLRLCKQKWGMDDKEGCWVCGEMRALDGGVPLYPCPRCKVPMYCSNKCGRIHHETHEKECGEIIQAEQAERMEADKGDAEEWVKGLNLHGENPPPVKENKPTGATPWLERVGVVNSFAETKYRIIHFGWFHNRGGEGE